MIFIADAFPDYLELIEFNIYDNRIVISDAKLN